MYTLKDFSDTMRRSLSERDQLVKKNLSDINKIYVPEVKSTIKALDRVATDFAINIAISDSNGNKGFASDGVTMAVNMDKFDATKAEDLATSLERFSDKLVDESKDLAFIDELSSNAARSYKDLAKDIRTQAKAFSDASNDVVSSIELDPVRTAFVKALPDSLVAEMSGMYNVTPVGSEMKFQNGFSVGNTNLPYSIPLSMLQTYYRMLTVIVARPIMQKPAIFMDELVEKIISTEELIKSSNNILQFAELEDVSITVSEGPPSYQRSVAVSTLLDKRSREAAMSIELSTVSLTMPIESFSNYVERLNFMRAEKLAQVQLKITVEKAIQDYIMAGKKPIVVATGDITTSATSVTATARPDVLPLTGVDFTGTQNGTLSEIDLGKIFSSIDLMESGDHITHMLVHAQAITTIFYTYQEKGLYNKEVDTNANMYRPNYGFEGMNPFAMAGLGKGGITDPYQNPLLFGYQGPIDPNGLIPRLINGLNPATADINMETILWNKFYVKVGQYEVIVLPYADAPVRMGGTDIRSMLKNSPVLAVNGRCTTDILLFNAKRTAILTTTGEVAHRFINTNDYKTTLSVAYSTIFSCYLKPYMKVYCIENVKIDSDRTHRVFNIRRT